MSHPDDKEQVVMTASNTSCPCANNGNGAHLFLNGVCMACGLVLPSQNYVYVPPADGCPCPPYPDPAISTWTFLSVDDEVKQALEDDPLYQERVTRYYVSLVEAFGAARKNADIPPDTLADVKAKVSFWEARFKALIRLTKRELTADDVFAAANINAQLEEAEKNKE